MIVGAYRVGHDAIEIRADVPLAPERIEELQKALRLLTRAGLNTSQAIERIQQEIAPSPELDELLEFIAQSERGFVK